MNIKNYIIPFLFLFTGCASTCKGVIGAPYHPETHAVLYTLTGSPAEGELLPGDVLIRPERINGEPGTEVTFLFIRNGNELLETKLKRVCVDELLEWKVK